MRKTVLVHFGTCITCAMHDANKNDKNPWNDEQSAKQPISLRHSITIVSNCCQILKEACHLAASEMASVMYKNYKRGWLTTYF